jgi:hypothetical protein
MASRNKYPLFSMQEGVAPFWLTFQGQGSGKAPICINGDPKNTWWNALARTNTGIYTITSVDGYPSHLDFKVFPMQATGAQTVVVQEYPAAVQLTVATATAPIGAWTFGFQYSVSGSLADPLVGDFLRMQIVMLNTGLPT